MFSAMPNRLSEMASTGICIDSYNNGQMQGRVCSAYLAEPVEFTNIVSLLKILEDIYNTGEFPQATMQTRSFSKRKDERPEKKDISSNGTKNLLNVRGKQATFRVKVMFRQNASWQGTVNWLEKGKEESFRSALELIMLMDSSFEGMTAKQQLEEQEELLKTAEM